MKLQSIFGNHMLCGLHLSIFGKVFRKRQRSGILLDSRLLNNLFSIVFSRLFSLYVSDIGCRLCGRFWSVNLNLCQLITFSKRKYATLDCVLLVEYGLLGAYEIRIFRQPLCTGLGKIIIGANLPVYNSQTGYLCNLSC